MTDQTLVIFIALLQLFLAVVMDRYMPLPQIMRITLRLIIVLALLMFVVKLLGLHLPI